ncbi:hypothetical protein [Corynebacterium occultum]|uniref:hypothetical protein n=1 Tax=Corynebacterium occultum TaxID=2675219 RepID=UPI0012E0DCBA|nr:hypothetical protein [Corynebacterium occultum]
MFTRDPDSDSAIAEQLGFRENSDTPAEGLVEDPRHRARALHLALDLAREFGFEARREITVDEVPFDRLGGIEAFNAERLSTLLQLRDRDGYLFPRSFYFEYDFVDSNDAYARVLSEMAEATGTREHFSEIHCDLHFGPNFKLQPRGDFRYLHQGNPRVHEVSSEGDFADPTVVAAMLRDVTPAEHTLITSSDGAYNYWVPGDHAQKFRTLLRAEEKASAKRHQRWHREREAHNKRG